MYLQVRKTNMVSGKYSICPWNETKVSLLTDHQFTAARSMNWAKLRSTLKNDWDFFK